MNSKKFIFVIDVCWHYSAIQVYINICMSICMYATACGIEFLAHLCVDYLFIAEMSCVCIAVIVNS